MKADLIRTWTPVNTSYSPFNLVKSETWSREPLFASPVPASKFLGLLDCLFMASYAVGLFVSGLVADRISPKLVFCTGMVLSCLVLVLFGFITELTCFYNKYFYAFLMILNGLFQSTSWPSSVAIMANWFGKSKGLIFGVWSSASAMGNIVGDLIAFSLLDYGYQYVALVCALLMLCMGVVTYCSIEDHPNNLAEFAKEIQVYQSDLQSCEPRSLIQQRLSFCQILLLPGVILYSLAYACIKMVNYAFFFWLPFYLNAQFNWNSADSAKVSAYYDLGAILGGIAAGAISDIQCACVSRHCVNMVFLVFSVPMLLIYKWTPDVPLSLNEFNMLLLGFVIGGPAAIIGAVFAADIKTDQNVAGKSIIATVTGIVDGTGSFGAAIGQLLVPQIGSLYGWNSIFYFFIAFMSTCILLVLPMFVQQLRIRCRVPQSDSELLLPSETTAADER